MALLVKQSPTASGSPECVDHAVGLLLPAATWGLAPRGMFQGSGFSEGAAGRATVARRSVSSLDAVRT